MELTTVDPAPATPRSAPAGPPGASLPAHEAPWARRLRADPHTLAELARAAGGPFHVLHPDTFADNVRSFTAALRTAGVDGQVYFGKKANKSACWLSACVETGAGVDVASVEELSAALAAGVGGRDLVVTGPAKSTALLDLAVRCGALIAVDALDELDRLISQARGGPTARILLRVVPPAEPHSRFGLESAALGAALERCALAGDAVSMHGFSFHLSGYDPAPRAALAAELVECCVAARALGLRADTVSIGGGFAVDYVEEAAWRAFVAEHDDTWFHAGRAPARYYPYHQEPAGADMLAAILGAAVGAAGTLSAALTHAGVRLVLEPGRALLDRAGLSVFGVQGYKPREGYGIVTVDGLSHSLSEQWKGSEFLPDPWLWDPDPDAGNDPVAACVGGASCLEYDMLTWRKVPFPRAPRHGDLLVYPNTAGYQMDKNESGFHQRPLPERFTVTTEDGGLSWRSER